MSRISRDEKERLLKASDKEYEYKKNIINWIIKKQQVLSVGEMSRRLDRSKETVIKLIGELNEKGYDIRLNEDTKEVEEIKGHKTKPKLVRIKYRRSMKIGFISDTHIGSIYQQLSLLHSAYSEMEKAGVNYCLHAGDLSDGPRSMHKRTPEEVFINDTDEMIDYISKVYPKTEKFKTYILDSGTHDTYWKRHYGENIVRRVCQLRDDIILRRGDEAQFVLEGSENVIARLIHPTGGIAYSRSYRPQKILEGVMAEFLEHLRRHGITEEIPDDNALPHIFALGHYHLFNWLVMGAVESIMLPCFQSQTPYLRDRGLHPNVGFLIAEFHFDQNKRVSRLKIEPYRLNAYVHKRDY